MSVAPTAPPSAPSPSRRQAAPARRFDDALRRAEAGSTGRPRAPVQRHVRPLARGLSGRQRETPSASAPPPAPLSPPGPTAPPGIPELQAAVRAAPPAIVAAARGAQAGQLSLSFGAALSVDLRTGAQGLELSLRPAPSLERAARAELPRLVEALRARGVRVAGAVVKARTA
jgi:hypothetical protein